MPEKKVLITLNARNENDQQLFCRDLAESIAEVSLWLLIFIYIYAYPVFKSRLFISNYFFVRVFTFNIL